LGTTPHGPRLDGKPVARTMSNSTMKANGAQQWRLAVGGVIIGAACAFAAPAAWAQQVAVIVNGEPITTYDIEQRSKLTQLRVHKTPPRDEVVNDLIDEKLKVQIGKR
jgi:peptidyl-prolyl cis-trans isomerase SurA